MIAVDTNLLVHAHREDSPWHEAAATRITELAEHAAPWAIPWPCVHEFLAIVTHPRIFAPPSPLERALAQVSAWLEAPGLVLLAESEGYWAGLGAALMDGPDRRSAGPRRARRGALLVARRAGAVDGRPGLRSLPRADGQEPARPWLRSEPP